MARKTVKAGKKGQQSIFKYPDYIKSEQGPELVGLAEEIADDLVANTENARKVLNKEMVGTLEGTLKYLGAMKVLGNKIANFFGKGINIEIGSQPQLVKAMRDIGKALSVNASAIDHKEVNVALTSLVLIFGFLEDIRRQVKQDYGSKNKGPLSDRRSSTGADADLPGKLQIEIGGVKNKKTLGFTFRELDQLIADVQFNIAASASLEKLMVNQNFNAKDLNIITQEFLDDVDYDLTATKQKVIDMASGRAETTFAVTSRAYNTHKGLYEKYLKRYPFVNQLGGLAGVNRKIVNDMKKDFEPNKPKSLSALKGSRSMSDEIAQQAVDTLVKGKSKSYRAKGKKTTKRKAKTKNRVSNVKKDVILQQALTAAAFKKAADATKRTKPKRKEKGEKDLHLSQKEINKVVTRINKRLPAEVRRQMGRPALINRTGRFSNSAELLSLKATRGGMAGKFSYMLSPYETFENTGEKRWPVGYNPKPLIAKSIRNLAQQYTETRITQLRRTY